MRIVYALSDKGARECAAAHSTLPVELHGLLRMVDGRRTREDLLAATGKSALTAGGLRWLSASGYIQPSEMPTWTRGRHQPQRLLRPPRQRTVRHRPCRAAPTTCATPCRTS